LPIFEEETGWRTAAKLLARGEQGGWLRILQVTELVAALRLKHRHYSGIGILFARA